jgi:fumarylacetoacetate (FAA) hydrolase
MKLVTYKTTAREGLGLMIDGQLFDLNTCGVVLPDNMADFLRGGDICMDKATRIDRYVKSNRLKAKLVEQYELLAPVPKPTSCRDGYAFRQHVESARRNRGAEMIKEFDQYPIFTLPTTRLFMARVTLSACQIISTSLILNWRQP